MQLNNNGIYQTSGWCFSRALIGYSNLRDIICYSPPGIVLDFVLSVFPLFSEKRKKNYMVLAIHWFDIYQKKFTSVSVKSGMYFPC